MKTPDVVLTVSLLFFCAGCVIPWGEGDSPLSRGSLVQERFAFIHAYSTTKESLAFIQANSTTKAEILLTLGEPDIVSPDEKHFLYWWLTEQVVTVFSGYILSANASILSHHYLLAVEFDERDIVKRSELKTRTRGGRITSLFPIPDETLIEDEIRGWGK